jgi:hypothetical protein
MAIDLPALPKTATVVPGLTDNSARLKPPLGGPSQTILRGGNRYYARVTIPALRNDTTCARGWLAAMLRHKTEGGLLRLAWPQAGASTLPAAAKVDGAGQAGALLVVKGLAPGSQIPALAFFSAVSGGRSYLHSTTSPAAADFTGRAALTIAPSARFSPPDNLALNFPAPIIEGELDTGPVEWTLERLLYVGISFTLTEIE